MLAKPRAVVMIAALIAVTGAGAANAATAHKKKPAPKPIVTKFYLNGNSAKANSCTEAPSLSTKLDASNSEGCGIVGGVPAEEVFYQSGAPDTTTYATTSKDGMPLHIDVKRKITGQIGTESWTGVVGGAGTVQVDLEIDAVTNLGTSVVISQQKLSAALAPNGSAVTNIPFTAAIPGSLAGKTLASFSVSTTIHGVYLDQGAKHYQGDSYVIVPGFK